MTNIAKDMVAAIEGAKVNIVASVPDEWLAPVIEALNGVATVKLAPAAREEDAIGICCGAALAGVRALCLVQSAGALNSGGVLATLANTYGVPFIMVIADRGHLGDATVFHYEKARATRPFLAALEIPHYELGPDFNHRAQIEHAFQMAEAGQKPVALLITPASFGEVK